MSASLPNTHPAYQVGSTSLSTPVLTGATSPAPTSAPQAPPTPQQLAQAAQDIPLFGGFLQLLEGLTPGSGLIAPAAAQLGASGDFNPVDIAGAAVGGFTTGLAGDIVGALGQAILGVLTAIGHGIANGLVALAQWLGGLAKAHVIALAVAGVVLLLMFR